VTVITVAVIKSWEAESRHYYHCCCCRILLQNCRTYG